MPAAIQVGDIVDVTLRGVRARSLAGYEVVSLPTNNGDYWEFEGPSGDIIATRDPIVTKRP